jgi:glutaminyl-tRNA synthetase
MTAPIYTRFPPEPNGFLHIGHVKAMEINFNKHAHAKCGLRFDDTNPLTEKQIYVDNIIKDMKWLGYNPAKITYTSDYFHKLHEIMVGLIKKGLAYIDFQSKEDIRRQRLERIDSKYRDVNPEHNLKCFKAMKNGEYKEGECVLRLKMDMSNDNPNLRDPVAYRIISGTHYRTGGEWRIYPSYDYSHCIVDHLENITYSYCSQEFESRRKQYYEILKMVFPNRDKDDFPIVDEFSRLDINTAVLSKRKIKKLIDDKVVSGFNDPRLFTVSGLRTRGYTPDVIREFVKEIEFSKNTSAMISPKLLDHKMRVKLDHETIRCFAVLNPVKVIIDNYSDLEVTHFTRPNHPKRSELGEHQLHLTKTFYIDRNDFRSEANRKYYGLTTTQPIRLKYGHFIRYVSHVETDDNVTELHVTFFEENDTGKRIRGCIHWVPDTSDKVIFHKLSNLYIENEKLKNKRDIKASRVLNENSYITYDGYAEPYLKDVECGTMIQFERVGYYKKNSANYNSINYNSVVELRSTYK